MCGGEVETQGDVALEHRKETLLAEVRPWLGAGG